ncbi:MAG: cysteine desulfurase NifS [Candidatus Woesearchaeota archaeon]|nr:cysteine desulfurase NifS [Candidatus Woesearchaeota archaeon]
MKRIYLDHAATTPVAKEVLAAMLPYFSEKYGNANSLHAYGREAKQALEKSRETIAGSINALPEEIIFTSGGTESDNIAIKELFFTNREKNHIITSKIEHDAVLNTCKFLENMGAKVTYLDVDKYSIINLDQLKNAITEKTLLVSIMHANNEIGTVQDIEKIGKICRERNVIFHTDAVQSYCKERIDVKKQNIDMMSLSAHKIYGPKGVGALYVGKGIKKKIGTFLHGGGHEFGLRSGTENIAGIVGFAKAVEIAQRDFEKNNKKMRTLRDELIKGVLKIPETFLNGHPAKRLSNNANFIFKYVEGEGIVMKLDDKGVAASTGSACSSKSLKPSHVLLALGLKPEDAHGSLRLTLGKDNTKKEIDHVLAVLSKAVEELRKASPFWRK